MLKILTTTFFYICTENSVNSAAECNGTSSCSGSPLAAEAGDSSNVSVLWKHGYCKWPGCEADCDNSAVFLRSSLLLII